MDRIVFQGDVGDIAANRFIKRDGFLVTHILPSTILSPFAGFGGGRQRVREGCGDEAQGWFEADFKANAILRCIAHFVRYCPAPIKKGFH